jgi:hypothetical protein
MMNKKGITALTVIFSLIVFWIVWIFFIAPLINVIVEQAMDTGNITGLSALILTNLNLIIGFLSLVILFWVVRDGP